MNAQELIFDALLHIKPEVDKIVSEQGETIVPEKGHLLYNQYTGLYYSELFANNKFRNPFYQKPEILQRAVRCWEYYYSLTNEEGKTRLVTFNNYWGECIDEWGVIHWMNSLEMLKNDIDPAIKQRWQERIDVIMRKQIIPLIEAELNSNVFRYSVAQHAVRNHFCWHVVAAYRYGMLNDHEKAMQVADEIMNLIAAGQTITGTWYEGRTLVSKYATVTIGALCKYYALSGNPNVFAALRRSLNYISKLLYPDFTISAAVDSRNRYSKNFAPMHFPSAYSFFEEGTQVVSAFVKSVTDSLKDDSWNGTQGIAMLVENYRHIKADFNVLPLDKFNMYPESINIPEEKVLILKDKQWVVPMCCQEVKTLGSRWILERQNLFSVYHDESGVFIGGGHSIAQPELSCFNIISHGKLTYLHENGTISNSNDGMELTYDGKDCKVHFQFDGECLRIRYGIEGLSQTERAYVNIPLVVSLGEEIRVDNTCYTFDKQNFSHAVPPNGIVEYKGRRIRLSEDGVVSYPLLPYNSYIVNHKKSYDETFCIISVEFEHNFHDLVVQIA